MPTHPEKLDKAVAILRENNHIVELGGVTPTLKGFMVVKVDGEWKSYDEVFELAHSV